MCIPKAEQPAVGDVVTVETQLGTITDRVADVRTVADVAGPRVEIVLEGGIKAYGTALVTA